MKTYEEARDLLMKGDKDELVRICERYSEIRQQMMSDERMAVLVRKSFAIAAFDPANSELLYTGCLGLIFIGIVIGMEMEKP